MLMSPSIFPSNANSLAIASVEKSTNHRTNLTHLITTTLRKMCTFQMGFHSLDQQLFFCQFVSSLRQRFRCAFEQKRTSSRECPLIRRKAIIPSKSVFTISSDDFVSANSLSVCPKLSFVPVKTCLVGRPLIM